MKVPLVSREPQGRIELLSLHISHTVTYIFRKILDFTGVRKELPPWIDLTGATRELREKRWSPVPGGPRIPWGKVEEKPSMTDAYFFCLLSFQYISDPGPNDERMFMFLDKEGLSMLIRPTMKTHLKKVYLWMCGENTCRSWEYPSFLFTGSLTAHMLGPRFFQKNIKSMS